MFVVDWHTDGSDARWKEIQGNPAYQGLRRMRLKQLESYDIILANICYNAFV